MVDMGKQTRQGLHQDLLNDLSDDFDQLTKNVELKKLQEHFQKWADEVAADNLSVHESGLVQIVS